MRKGTLPYKVLLIRPRDPRYKRCWGRVFCGLCIEFLSFYISFIYSSSIVSAILMKRRLDVSSQTNRCYYFKASVTPHSLVTRCLWQKGSVHSSPLDLQVLFISACDQIFWCEILVDYSQTIESN